MYLKIIALFIILSISFFILAGFFSMSFMNNDGNHTCFVSLMTGKDCSALSSVEMALYYMSGLKNFTQAIINFNINLFIIFISIVFLVFILVKFLRNNFLNRYFSYLKYFIAGELAFRPKKDFFRWLVINNTLGI